MNTRTGVSNVLLFLGLVFAFSLVALSVASQRAFAQGNTAEGANASCMPFDPICECGTTFDPQMGCVPGANRRNCPCQNTTNGKTTTGKCDRPMHCKAEVSGGSPVDSILQQLGQMLSQALQKLMSGGGGGGGGGGQPPPQGGGIDTGSQIPCDSGTAGGPLGKRGTIPSTTPCANGCTTYYQVSTPSSDPCAIYVPNIANDLTNATGGNTAGDLFNSLNGTGNISNISNTPIAPGTASNLGVGGGDTAGRTNNNNNPAGGILGGNTGFTLGGGAGVPACATAYFVTQTPSTDPCAIFVPASSVSNGITTGAAAGGLADNGNTGSGGVAAGGTANNNNSNTNVGGATAPACISSYFVTQTPSTDPCAIFVPASSVSNGITTGGSSTGSINNKTTNGGGSGGGTQPSRTTPPPSPNSLIGLISNPANLSLASTTETVVKNADGTVSTTTTYSFFGAQITVPNGTVPAAGDFTSFTTIANIISGGLGGDLQVGGNGATISSSNRDFQNNTAVSGFFGANATGGAGSQSVAVWLCHTRPWANSIFSRIISASFFDSLCAKRGYQVGMPPTPPKPATPVLTQIPVRAAAKPVAKPPVQAPTPPAAPTVPPRVQIWAVPASVSIGSRTSVFWSARGVVSCIETSPDGSFHHTSLSGGASTVPLTSATTYTISCLTPDGTPATAFFTVKMAI